MFRSAGVANFDKLLDKATSNLLLEVDLYSVMGICDLIRQKDCPPRYAIVAIKKKLSHQNPHVVFYSLQVLESIVKNCGSPVHDEVANKEFMEYLRDLAKATTHENVRDKILELIQAWAHAFRKLPAYRAVQDCMNIMKAEGCKFPPLIEADAMFCADTAPEWQEGGCCHRCRVEFGLMNRRHHCRAIFCSKCSSKQTTLPKFGIEKEVRVCDSCYEKNAKRKSPVPTDKKTESDGGLQAAIEASLADYNAKNVQKLQHSQTQQPPRGKTEEELAEEEQLQLALAISQSEAEAKEREKTKSSTSYSSSPSTNSTPTSSSDRESEKGFAEKVSAGPKKSTMAAKSSMEQDDPELARYLDRNYWEQRHVHTKEEVKRDETGTNLHNKTPSPFMPSAPVKENKSKVEEVMEIDGFVESLRGQIEIFVNRMRSNSSRGRHISNDTSVQTLFMNITALHSQLLNYIQAQDDWRSYYEGLQENLNQVHDARDALDSLRKEHSERIRLIAVEAERQRHIQLQIKLQDMRQKKHQYLQYQRDVALRKVQDEEKEMQRRIDQQRMGGGYGVYPIPGQGYLGSPGQLPPSMMGPPQHEPQQMHYMQQQHYLQGQHSNSVIGQQPPHPGPPPGHFPHQPQYVSHPGMHGPSPVMSQGPPGHHLPPHLAQGQMQDKVHPGQQQHVPPNLPPSSQQHMPQGIPPTSQQQQVPPSVPLSSHQQFYQPPLPQQQPMGPPPASQSMTQFNNQAAAGAHDMSQGSQPVREDPSTAELISFD